MGWLLSPEVVVFSLENERTRQIQGGYSDYPANYRKLQGCAGGFLKIAVKNSGYLYCHKERLLPRGCRP